MTWHGAGRNFNMIFTSQNPSTSSVLETPLTHRGSQQDPSNQQKIWATICTAACKIGTKMQMICKTTKSCFLHYKHLQRLQK